MAREIFRDVRTGEYTMKEKQADGTPNLSIIPAKFSPSDKWAKYRRVARERAADEDTH